MTAWNPPYYGCLTYRILVSAVADEMPDVPHELHLGIIQHSPVQFYITDKEK